MRQLKIFWQKWRRLAEAIGTFQARVILTAFYFVIVPPFAAVVCLCSDPLQLKVRRGQSAWVPRQYAEPSLATAHRQS